ncbi:MAG: P-loop NTPase fold protein, partial [Cyanobacteria bacterium P01_E01_bin.42]
MSTLSRYKATLQKWGLKENPFRPIPPDDPQELARIFYGRTDKIELALPALYEGRNILIRGAWGIGKTATILTLLHRLQAEVAELNEEMLVLYFGSIPGDSPNDFYRALLFGLADTLKEKDEEAAAIFDSIRGVSFTKAKKNIEGKVNLGILSLGAKPTPSEVQA